MYAFTYHRPDSVRKASSLLTGKEDAKLIAGMFAPVRSRKGLS